MAITGLIADKNMNPITDPNPIEAVENLKSLPDNTLAQYAQDKGNPNATYALVVLMQRLTARKKVEKEVPSNTTVAEDVAQDVTGGGLAGLQGAAPMMAEEQGVMTPPPSPDQLTTQGVGSLPAENIGQNYAGGGIVSFQEGGNVGDILKQNLFGGRGLNIPSYATTDISDKLPKKSKSIFGFSYDNPVGVMDPILGAGNFARYTELKRKQQGVDFSKEPLTPSEAYELNMIEKQIAESKKEPMPEVEKPKLKDIEVTDKKSELISEEPKSIFESSRAPDLDKMFKEEDLTGKAESEAERFKTMLGEDEVTKEARERLAKREERIKEREGSLLGESLFAAGAKMLQSRDPFFSVGLGAGLEEGLNRYTVGKQEINKLKDVSDQLSMDINKVKRAEETAATKFGLESEERRRATNERNRLEKDKAKIDQYKFGIQTQIAEKELAAKEQYYNSLAGTAKARMAETIRKAKLSVMESEEYRQARRQLEKKYGGRTDDPNYQREAQTLYNTFLNMALPDVAYEDNTSSSTNTLSADDLLGI